MEISFEINTEKGDAIVVSLLSSYQFIKDIVDQSRFSDIEVIDVSIVRKSGNNTISSNVLKEIVSRISDIVSSSPNAILFYLCDSTDPIPNLRATRTILCQEYRDRLFNLMFSRFSNELEIEWRDYRIETSINGDPQFAHLIYRTEHKDTVDDIGREILRTFKEIELQK